MVTSPSSHKHICWGGPPTPHPRHTLSIEHVSFNYGPVCALNDVHFEIGCGSTLAVMGPNGAGKSTLINIVAGLLKPKSGKVLWNGKPLKEAAGEVAYLPQRSDIDWTFPLTVRAVVEMGRFPSLGIWRKFSRHDHEIVEKSLAALNLSDLAGRQIGALSGGQQQRVFLARALAQEAHLLLLDEPFAGLDSPSSSALGELLGNLAREGRLIMVSHHDLNTAGQLFDSVLLLKQGVVSFGKCHDTLTSETINRTYGGDLPSRSSFSPHP